MQQTTREHLAALSHEKNTKLFGILSIIIELCVIVVITTQIIQR